MRKPNQTGLHRLAWSIVLSLLLAVAVFAITRHFVTASRTQSVPVVYGTVSTEATDPPVKWSSGSLTWHNAALRLGLHDELGGVTLPYGVFHPPQGLFSESGFLSDGRFAGLMGSSLAEQGDRRAFWFSDGSVALHPQEPSPPVEPSDAVVHGDSVSWNQNFYRIEIRLSGVGSSVDPEDYYWNAGSIRFALVPESDLMLATATLLEPARDSRAPVLRPVLDFFGIDQPQPLSLHTVLFLVDLGSGARQEIRRAPGSGAITDVAFQDGKVGFVVHKRSPTLAVSPNAGPARFELWNVPQAELTWVPGLLAVVTIVGSLARLSNRRRSDAVPDPAGEEVA